MGFKSIRSGGVRRPLWFMSVVFLFSVVPALAGVGEARVLWVSAGRSVFKVSPQDGTPTLELTALPRVQALAVDRINNRVWVYSHKHLWAYDAYGNVLLDTSLPRNFHGDAPAGMVVDAAAGNVWIGHHRKLYRLDLNGNQRAVLTLDRKVRGLALDYRRSQLWVAEDRSIVVLDKEGNTVLPVYLSRAEHPTAIAYDGRLDQVWVAFEHEVARYDRTGTEIFSLALPNKIDLHHEIAADGAGGLWLAGARALAYLDPSGQLRFTLEPFVDDSSQDDDAGARRKIVDLAADALDHTTWVASGRYLKQYRTDGALLQTVDSRTWLGEPRNGSRHREEEGDGIRHVGLYVDILPPTIAFSTPKNGSYTNRNQPAFTLAWSDAGSGVDPATLKVTSDGVSLPVNCQTSDTGAQCTVASALADGTYTLFATVADYAGNVSPPGSVSFTVDTVPPPLPAGTALGFVAGPSGKVLLAGQAGAVAADAAAVILTNIRTGQTVMGTVDPDGSFSVPAPGASSDEFAITLTDWAGNVSTPFYMHGGDTPLRLAISSPAAGASIAGSLVNVTGTLQGPANSGITVNGVPAVLSHGRWVANNVSLHPGVNTLTVTAITSGGLQVTQTLGVMSTGASALILNATPTASGVAPLAVTFQYQFLGETAPRNLRVDYTGSGSYVTVSDPVAALSYTYSNPGIYPVTLTLTDSNNGQYQAQVWVVVQDAEQMDTLFKGIWSDMTTALASGNEAAAMNTLDGTAQRHYGPVFDVLMPHMRDIVSSFSPLLRSSISASIGEYAVVRPGNGQQNVFLIYFIKDRNGVWRLDAM